MRTGKYQYQWLVWAILLLLVWSSTRAEGNDKAAGPPAKVYAATAILNASTDPTVTELENTTGAVVNIFRVAAGQYHIESNPPVFTVGRTLAFHEFYNMGPSVTLIGNIRCAVVDYCDLRVFHANPFGDSLYFYDGGSAGLPVPIRIEVYP